MFSLNKCEQPPFDEIFDCGITVFRLDGNGERLTPAEIDDSIRSSFAGPNPPSNYAAEFSGGYMDRYFEDVADESGGDNGVYITFGGDESCQPCIRVLIEYSQDCDDIYARDRWGECTAFDVSVGDCGVPMCAGGALYRWRVLGPPDENGDRHYVGFTDFGPAWSPPA